MFENPNYSSGHRVWHAILAVFLGPAFLLGAALLIFWNEHHALHVANSLTEGASIVIEANAAEIDPALEGKLVHLSRDLRPEGTLQDAAFGVKTNAVKLERKVEMYQWIEKRRSERHGNSTEYFYSYAQNWSDHVESSGSFNHRPGHENPDRMAFSNATYEATLVRMGAYQVGSSLLGSLKSSEPLPLTASELTLPAGAQVIENGKIYVGHDPQSPQVGDLRITERIVPAGAASVVAAVKGGRLAPYHASGGSDIALLRMGTHDSDSMFANAQAQNKSLAWIFRGLGLLGLFLGFQCILSPVATLASFLPVLGGLFREGVAIISMLGAGVIWSVLVAISWIAARPLLGGGLLLAAAIGAAVIVAKLFRRQAATVLGVPPGSRPPPPPMGQQLPPRLPCADPAQSPGTRLP